MHQRDVIKMADDIFYRLLFVGLYGLFLIVRGYYRFVKPRQEEPDAEESEERRGFGLGGMLIIIGILGSFGSYFLYLFGVPLMDLFQYDLYPIALRWFGVALVLIVIPLLGWIHRTLDRQYSAQLEIKSEHKLITVGPYAKVRHPMYTVLGLFSLGIALLTANTLIIAFTLIIIVGFPLVAKQEEQMLIDEFGEEYLEYMKRTRRFFPI
jgi:protein-S-isoprenylcysteine O-methyltransferase Ste14